MAALADHWLCLLCVYLMLLVVSINLLAVLHSSLLYKHNISYTNNTDRSVCCHSSQLSWSIITVLSSHASLVHRCVDIV